ncbi:hypothetical protein KJ359_008919 [Pestalotiopsis sp. 9143b]|nr:hypothetical protein KJ359_008919 [Pestalotiopsis sp. 9143b]
MSLKTEALREREVSRIAPELFEHTRSLRTSSLCCGDPTDQHALPGSSADPALDAFAQLGALRLDATRCLISIFDRKHQYIVAESTKESVVAPYDQQQNAGIWLGGSAIPRSHGICEHVLFAADDAPDRFGAKLQVSVVPDLAEDYRFCNRSYILERPCNRFYAGVPLKSRNGVNVGVLCVFDESPRAGLSDTHLDCLRGLSQIISGYLEFKETATGFGRSERMVRGLGSFVEGKTTMSGPQISVNSTPCQSVGSESKFSVQRDPVALTVEDDTEESHDDQAQPKRPTPSPIQTGLPTSDGSSGKSSDPKPASCPGSDKAKSTTFTVNSLGSTRTISTICPSESLHPKEVRNIFNRAATIIRESIDVDGVLFLDASIRTYAGLVEADDASQTPGSSPNLSATAGDLYQDEENGPRICNSLGFSMSGSSTVSSASINSPDIQVPEKLLRELLKRYPRGRVFNFDDNGSPLQFSDEEADPLKSTEPVPVSPTISELSELESRRRETELIASIFPGAVSVSLIPLWDTRRERWFAGSFIWTKAAARSFTNHGETGYLHAFASSIMAEVDRVNTTTAEQTKSDLLGSLSHEIRSPLHGIVAALELLQDTELDAFQGDLLQTMDSCGRTLLDVIDHLLEHSKVSKLAKTARPQDEATKHENKSGMDKYRSFQSQLRALSHAVDLDALVEETVESMFSSHSSQAYVASISKFENQEFRIPRKPVSTWPVGNSERNSLGDIGGTTQQSGVSVYLDIDPESPWYCRVEAGAVRRIIMNLLGNSLKYTSRGFIRVSMKQEQYRAKHGQPHARLVLNVLDSGKGMSHEFLQHHAFEPFTQEDPLSQGTGLGLSLISQILHGLGGTIRLESQLGHGTSATVCIPLKTSCVLEKPESQFSENVLALKGLRVSLCGLKTGAEASGISSSNPPIELDLIETVCRNWLHLEPIAHGSEDIRPDIIVCTDIAMHDALMARDSVPPPVVVICHSAVIAHSLSLKFRQTRKGEAFEFIPQPVGPRKLANAMILALGRYNDAKASDLVASEPPQSIYANPMITPDYTPGVELPVQSSWIPDLALSPIQLMNPQPIITNDLGESSPMPLLPEANELVELGLEMSMMSLTRDEILLVDDNNINLQILVSFMKKLKYKYKTASNGLEAFEIYSASPGSFSHVLMDISMPVMDGLESTRNIRTLEAERHIAPTKVIALTGLVSADAQQEAFASGVDMYMTKPVRFKNLSSVLASYAPQEV